MSEESSELISKKAQMFLDRSIAVHIETKDGTFYNGFISEVSADFLEVNDRKFGNTIVFFVEITVFRPFFLKEGDSP